MEAWLPLSPMEMRLETSKNLSKQQKIYKT